MKYIKICVGLYNYTCLNELHYWLINNNILLNHNITEVLDITNDTNTDFPDILINQYKSIPTNSIKYIGIYVITNLI